MGRQAGCGRIERIDHVAPEHRRRFLAPVVTAAHPPGKPLEQNFEVADHFKGRRYAGVKARCAGQRQHGLRVRPGLGLKLNGIEPDRDDQIRLGYKLALDQPANDAPCAQRMILRYHALALGGRQHRRPKALGQRDQFGRGLAPEGSQPDEDDWLFRGVDHADRLGQVGSIRTGNDAIRHKWRERHRGDGLFHRFALGHIEMDRSRGR